ncbi:hypothetical protein XBJ2_1550002 [Xenorhabdus bovienii str. Jollieti]|uniref:Uncharacterized protein n=1 Tax=Xenorhabdus bovienii (strain SS-2004) TaxID=406818 RepID=D3V7Y6_XENBS|nr:hypothetical protein XBJ1_2824 [Xenorhabdus bovienii SS-2004]CDH27781.1 hypothetical protein XBJ2_1550002 [Xenorhabdus bovienii str. Jollieti]
MNIEFTNEIRASMKRDRQSAIRYVIECKRNYLDFRQWAMDHEPRSTNHRALNRLAWQQRKFYRKWAALS